MDIKWLLVIIPQEYWSQLNFKVEIEHLDLHLHCYVFGYMKHFIVCVFRFYSNVNTNWPDFIYRLSIDTFNLENILHSNNSNHIRIFQLIKQIFLSFQMKSVDCEFLKKSPNPLIDELNEHLPGMVELLCNEFN